MKYTCVLLVINDICEIEDRGFFSFSFSFFSIFFFLSLFPFLVFVHTRGDCGGGGSLGSCGREMIALILLVSGVRNSSISTV